MNLTTNKRQATPIVIMADRQALLAEDFLHEPSKAWVTDVACTNEKPADLSDPLHTKVTVAGVDILLGVHPAVGGDGDAPIPGEILAAAIAGCLDSTIRIIANRLNIELSHLSVVASLEADVRGTLRLNPSVPVGFQKLHVSADVKAAKGTAPGMLKALIKASEESCVVIQTLRNPSDVTTQFNLSC